MGAGVVGHGVGGRSLSGDGPGHRWWQLIFQVQNELITWLEPKCWGLAVVFRVDVAVAGLSASINKTPVDKIYRQNSAFAAKILWFGHDAACGGPRADLGSYLSEDAR